MDFERTPYPEHPNRCQAVNSKGQCNNLGLKLDEGKYGSYCLAHGGNRARQAQKKQSMRNYQLTKWQARLEEKADAAGIKSLRDEIGILRICVEEKLNTCDDAMDLILASGTISDMVMKIERVVTSCHKLEGSMGQLLDKQAILQFAQVIIAIIGEELKGDEERINTIADRIVASVSTIGQME